MNDVLKSPHFNAGMDRAFFSRPIFKKSTHFFKFQEVLKKAIKSALW